MHLQSDDDCLAETVMFPHDHLKAAASSRPLRMRKHAETSFCAREVTAAHADNAEHTTARSSGVSALCSRSMDERSWGLYG